MQTPLPPGGNFYEIAEHIEDETGLDICNKISFSTGPSYDLNINVHPVNEAAVTAALSTYVHNPGYVSVFHKRLSIQQMG